MKKKILAGTVAASLTFTALAGLPLSSKGLAEKLGISVAYAADSSSLASWAEKISAQLSVSGSVYPSSVADAVYLQGEGGHSVASVTYTVYAADPFTVRDTVYNIADPVVGKLNLGDEDSADRQAFDNLVAGLIKFMFNQNTAIIDGLREDQAVEDAIHKIDPTLTFANLDSFFFDATTGVQGAIITKLRGMSIGEVAALANSQDARDSFFDSLFNSLIKNGTSPVAKALNDNGVIGKDFADVIRNFRDAIGSDVFDTAAVELFVAYEKAYDAYGYNPGTGVGGGPTTVISPSVTQLVQDLAGLKSQIAAATGAEKDKLIAQAVTKANDVIEKILTLDLSAQVQNVNGKATLTLSAADVTKLITAVADAKKALADAVGSSDGLDIGEITISLGAITQSGASVVLPQELWTLANDAKADGVAIKVGALSATLPTGTFTEAVTLGLTIETGDAASSVTSGVYGKSVASDVYGFDLQVGGKTVDEFNKPIKLRLPLKNLTGVDKELLTTGRVEADGTVSTQGGTIDGDYIVEQRYSFSKYFVFENKVSFNDIAKVQGWAGRQIQVVAAKGAIEGKSAGVFAPQDKITRAEFAKILITALNLDNKLATSSKFSDVPASHWAAPYIAVAAEQGIINGKSPSTFAPNATITRAEMATMIARALKVTQDLKDIDNVEAALSVFKDANKIGSAFRSSVAWAAASDIIIGANGKFLPNDNATRAEAAVIIYRALNFKPQAPQA
ncbi:S-layer homology domain-containing protein [Cohnella sp. JJ-181]|uniref:S-layer homology domain-containing protein n=1 Tax=Cohnella rhizoplanae TaxID=2974897 RepID=UPI00232E423B|nr:S-layer homology domain-containing protein [Cohnella sp. JJ-181]